MNGKIYDLNSNKNYQIKNGMGIIREYDNVFGELIFEGQFSYGEKTGKGKEYYYFTKKVKFEGEYANGKKMEEEKNRRIFIWT